MTRSRNEGLRRFSSVDNILQPIDTDVAAGQSGAQNSAPHSRRSSRHSSRSKRTSPELTPIQRIKSLSDFHLYLSPSKLAHRDLLSDSETESEPDSGDEQPELVSPPRRTLRPAVLDQIEGTSGDHPRRPPLRLLGNHLVDENVRSYSDQLQAHHAKILESYAEAQSTHPEPDEAVAGHIAPDTTSGLSAAGHETETTKLTTFQADEANVSGGSSSTDMSSTVPAQETPMTSPSVGPASKPISPYSPTNPFFGYPTVQHGSLIRPRYGRRKRDLVKTLVFLFILRLQSVRFSVERYFGLHPNLPHEDIRPTEGLMTSSKMIQQSNRQGLKVWLVMILLLMRGTWAKLLATPLELLGIRALTGWFEV